MLEQFRQAKEAEINSLRTNNPPAPWHGKRPDFAGALRQNPITVISEYKRSSPSRGSIRTDLDVATVARQYSENGAAAMSVLTEQKYFDGRLEFIKHAFAATAGILPILRKDFIFNPLQITATAATPASALLLIARMLPDAQSLAELRRQTEALGLDAVIEVFDGAELEMARDAGAKLIQVNARDLQTLQVSREACIELIKRSPPRPGELWIAASGISAPEHLLAAHKAGFQSALIGTSLMEKSEPGEALRDLLHGCMA